MYILNMIDLSVFNNELPGSNIRFMKYDGIATLT